MYLSFPALLRYNWHVTSCQIKRYKVWFDNTYILQMLATICAVLSCFNRVPLFANLWAVAHQAPLSMGFSRHEYWSGLPYPPPGGRSDPGIKPVSFMSLVSSGQFFTTSTTWEAPYKFTGFKYCKIFCNIKLAWNLWRQNTFLWKWKSLSHVQLFATPWTV